jgi:hypothetical protein
LIIDLIAQKENILSCRIFNFVQNIVGEPPDSKGSAFLWTISSRHFKVHPTNSFLKASVLHQHLPAAGLADKVLKIRSKALRRERFDGRGETRL